MAANIQIPNVASGDVPVASSSGRSRLFLDEADGLLKLKDYLGDVTSIGGSGALVFSSIVYDVDFPAEINTINLWDPSEVLTSTLPAAPSNNTLVAFLPPAVDYGTGGSLLVDAGANPIGSSVGPTTLPVLATTAGTPITLQFQETSGPGVGLWHIVNTDYLLWAIQSTLAEGFVKTNDSGGVSLQAVADNSLVGRSNSGPLSDITVSANAVVADTGGGLTSLVIPNGSVLGRASGDLDTLTGAEISHIEYDPSFQQTIAGVTGSLSNYSPGAWDASWITSLTLVGNTTITGFAANTTADDFRQFRVLQSTLGSAGVITLRHQDSGSTVFNRITTPNGVDYTINSGDSVVLIYDVALFNWKVVGRSTAASTQQTSTTIDNTTSPYAAKIGEFIRVSLTLGNVVINLPTAAGGVNKEVVVKVATQALGNTCTVTPFGGQTIDESGSLSLSTDYEWAGLRSNGTNWMQVS